MIIVLLFAAAVVAIIYYYKQTYDAPKRKTSGESQTQTQPRGRSQSNPKKAKGGETHEAETKPQDASKEGQLTSKELKKLEHEIKNTQKKIRKANPTHKCFWRGFKGFREKIADFDVSPDGKCVVACSSDNTFRIYRPKDLNDQDPLCVYQKIDFYEPSAIAVKADKKLVAIGMGDAKMVEFYTLEEVTSGDEEKTKINITFHSRSADKLHKTTLKHLFLDLEGKFYVTGSDEDDTSIKAWNLNGDNLGTFVTAQLKNHHIVRSEDGRFLAVGAWTSDVMVLELKTNKDGSLKSLSKAMTLKGHRQGIIDLSFNNLTDKAVTLSKDQTMRLWNINVRYEMSEDPKCLGTVNLTEFEDLKNLGGLVRVALYTRSTDSGNIVVISHMSDLIVFDVEKNKVIEKITHAHSEGSKIYKLVFKTHENKPYLYTSGDDGRVNMWDFSSL